MRSRIRNLVQNPCFVLETRQSKVCENETACHAALSDESSDISTEGILRILVGSDEGTTAFGAAFLPFTKGASHTR